MVAQAKFTYNYSKHQTVGKSPFEVIYERQLMHLYDLAPSLEIGRNGLKGENMLDLMKELQEEINISNFQEGKCRLEEAQPKLLRR